MKNAATIHAALDQAALLLTVRELPEELLPCDRAPCGERTQFVITVGVIDSESVVPIAVCPECLAGFLRDQGSMHRERFAV